MCGNYHQKENLQTKRIVVHFRSCHKRKQRFYWHGKIFRT